MNIIIQRYVNTNGSCYYKACIPNEADVISEQEAQRILEKCIGDDEREKDCDDDFI